MILFLGIAMIMLLATSVGLAVPVVRQHSLPARLRRWLAIGIVGSVIVGGSALYLWLGVPQLSVL